ncbi:ABC transporter substrate-binding protein [Muricomes sp. OA1]|uniref:Carbohydrate ABC transporter substrate-binding protein n=2 Tax=Lachnospiraceae TaxID=186803 RepID=A0A3E2WI94_9FIRM|nr:MULTISPECIES: ABC transporter substrate-binding protein [Clostridia]MCH1972866.1 ABC transporter substrate-binding protein [Muricomes sp. OA1]RGC26671.1 carbohydrate ABC transporter substrate-binding protein [Hungatella hathewayi]GKH31636.1 solute-binding protein [Faecalicatena contorta]
MKKRRVMPMLMAGIFTVSAILGGCSQGGDDKGADAQKGSGSSKQETDANIYEYTKDDLDGRTISLVTSQDWWKDGMQALVDEYKEEFGVKIQVEILPSDTASEVIKSKFTTKELPDIIMNSASPAELTYMNASQNLEDLTEEPWVEKLNSIDGFVDTDGRLYGCPLAAQDYWGFCVNREVFEKCGLDIPESKEDLVDSFQVLQEKGYTPFYFGAGDSWMCGNITSSGVYADNQKDPDLIKKFNTNEMNYGDSESFNAMLQDLYDWSKDGYFGKNPMAQSWDGQFAAVADNECGVLIGLTSWFNEINAKYGEGTADKLTMIPYYIGENDTIYQSTSTQFYIPKGGKNIDVSKHFINWCAKDENLQAFYDSIGAVSPFNGIEPSQMTAPTKELLDKLSDGTYGVHVSHNSVIQGQDWDSFCQLLQEVVMNRYTPKQFCDEYDGIREGICQSLGLEGF